MKRFYYVKCLGDNSWLAKPANQGKFTKDIRKAAPLTEAEAKANGYGNAVYPLVPVAEVYPFPVTRSTLADVIARCVSLGGPEDSLPLGPDDRDEPFGGVAFDPLRKAQDVHPDSGYNNGQRADIGQGTLAAYCFLADKPEATAIHINDINLTEAPEEALTDLLTNLMHYCHREGIELYGDDGALPSAQRQFAAESGGAAL